jgi:Domain of unknown function (DUF6968)
MLIATRTLRLHRKSGDVRVPVRLYKPEQADGSWSCRYEIDWPDRPHSMTARGVDAMQAILLALEMIGATIYSSNYHKDGDLEFENPGQGYGFPVPTTLRDLLEGDDKKFF